MIIGLPVNTSSSSSVQSRHILILITLLCLGSILLLTILEYPLGIQASFVFASLHLEYKLQCNAPDIIFEIIFKTLDRFGVRFFCSPLIPGHSLCRKALVLEDRMPYCTVIVPST